MTPEEFVKLAEGHTLRINGETGSVWVESIEAYTQSDSFNDGFYDVPVVIMHADDGETYAFDTAQIKANYPGLPGYMIWCVSEDDNFSVEFLKEVRPIPVAKLVG